MKLTEEQKANLRARMQIKECPNCKSAEIALNVNIINLPSVNLVNGAVDTTNHASVETAVFMCTKCGYNMFFSL